jgi:D-glucosaminate-6-phosphate ammonia-lyase
MPLNIYERLGVPSLLNAQGHITRLGGSLIRPAALEAMVEAAQVYVDLERLQERIAERIALLTRNEAAYVCNGAAGGLVLAALACLSYGSAARLKDQQQERRAELVVIRNQYLPFFSLLEQVGLTLVEIGTILETTDLDLEGAIGDATIGILYVGSGFYRPGTLSIGRTVEIAHSRRVPVICDAAIDLPPKSNLWRHTAETGVDLAVFSGGKVIRGPQTSGFIVGSRDMVDLCRFHGFPNLRGGRALKVGKEEMVGLLVALEAYLEEDEIAILARWSRISEQVESGLRNLPAFRVSLEMRGNQGVLWVVIESESDDRPDDLEHLIHELSASARPVALELDRRARRAYLCPQTLEETDVPLLVQRVHAAAGAVAEAGR